MRHRWLVASLVMAVLFLSGWMDVFSKVDAAAAPAQGRSPVASARAVPSSSVASAWAVPSVLS